MVVVILAEDEGCSAEGFLYSWSRRVVLGIPAEEESSSRDPCGAGELF